MGGGTSRKGRTSAPKVRWLDSYVNLTPMAHFRFRIASLILGFALATSGTFGQGITGESASTLPTCPEQAPEAFLAWARKASVPLATGQDAAGFRDFQSLKKSIGPVRVVGLGEAARWVQEFYELRLRL